MKAEQEKEASAQENAANAAPAGQSPSRTSLPMDIPDVAKEVLDKIDGLTVEELVLRKGDSTIAIRPSGIVSGAVNFISPGSDVPASTAKAPEPAAPPPAEKEEEAPAEYSATIDAPFVGTLYLSPGPGKDVFVKEGDVVEAGGKVCIVEAMKLFNEITAPKKCRIVKILGTAGQAVEKGQPLIGIDEV